MASENGTVRNDAEQFDIHDVQTNLSRIIERVEHGEEIVIARAGTPVAKLVPFHRQADRRTRGSLRGRLVMAPDWDSDQVNDAIARDWPGEPRA
jgi:prevent-host-death family protein